MKNGIFTLIAILAMNLTGCATFLELDGGNDPSEMDRGYTAQDEGDCSGRFCDNNSEEDDASAAESSRKPAADAATRKMQRAIAARDVVLGMTRQQVADSWGEPYVREVAGDGNSGHERWTYGSRYSLSGNRTVIFENGRVAGWHR